MFPKEGALFVVAADGFLEDDIDMEHMGDVLVFFGAVALADGLHALTLQMVTHGLGAFPQEIVAGGGDVGRGKAEVIFSSTASLGSALGSFLPR